MRTLDSLEAVELPGTDRAAHPFWSPDGQAIGFIAGAKLKTIDLASGAVQTLADAPVRAGASWSRGESFKGDIWILDAARGTPSKITSTAFGEGTPVWSANGRRLMFQNGAHIVVEDLETRADEVLFDVAPGDRVADWSQDGASVVLLRSGASVVLSRSESYIFSVALAGARRPVPYLQTGANETQAQLAPNGRWIAYTSNESGR